jgi:hypothetical protein
VFKPESDCLLEITSADESRCAVCIPHCFTCSEVDGSFVSCRDFLRSLVLFSCRQSATRLQINKGSFASRGDGARRGKLLVNKTSREASLLTETVQQQDFSFRKARRLFEGSFQQLSTLCKMAGAGMRGCIFLDESLHKCEEGTAVEDVMQCRCSPGFFVFSVSLVRLSARAAP